MFLNGLARYFATHRPQHAVVHLTTQCNLRCTHCFVPKEKRFELAAPVLAGLARELGHFTWLGLSGGELFLRPDPAEAVSPFQAEIIQIPTNGTLGAAAVEQVKRLRGLSRAQVVVSISMDGMEGTHDLIRGKAGVWQKAWRTFDLLRELGGVSLKINTVLTRDNLRGYWMHMRNWGYHAPLVRGRLPTAKDGFLFPRNLWLLALTTPASVLGYTLLIWGAWLKSRPWAASLALPQILVGRVAYALGVWPGALALGRDAKAPHSQSG